MSSKKILDSSVLRATTCPGDNPSSEITDEEDHFVLANETFEGNQSERDDSGCGDNLLDEDENEEDERWEDAMNGDELTKGRDDGKVMDDEGDDTVGWMEAMLIRERINKLKAEESEDETVLDLMDEIEEKEEDMMSVSDYVEDKQDLMAVSDYGDEGTQAAQSIQSIASNGNSSMVSSPNQDNKVETEQSDATSSTANEDKSHESASNNSETNTNAQRASDYDDDEVEVQEGEEAQDRSGLSNNEVKIFEDEKSDDEDSDDENGGNMDAEADRGDHDLMDRESSSDDDETNSIDVAIGPHLPNQPVSDHDDIDEDLLRDGPLEIETDEESEEDEPIPDPHPLPPVTNNQHGPALFPGRTGPSSMFGRMAAAPNCVHENIRMGERRFIRVPSHDPLRPVRTLSAHNSHMVINHSCPLNTVSVRFLDDFEDPETLDRGDGTIEPITCTIRLGETDHEDDLEWVNVYLQYCTCDNEMRFHLFEGTEGGEPHLVAFIKKNGEITRSSENLEELMNWTKDRCYVFELVVDIGRVNDRTRRAIATLLNSINGPQFICLKDLEPALDWAEESLHRVNALLDNWSFQWWFLYLLLNIPQKYLSDYFTEDCIPTTSGLTRSVHDFLDIIIPSRIRHVLGETSHHSLFTIVYNQYARESTYFPSPRRCQSIVGVPIEFSGVNSEYFFI